MGKVDFDEYIKKQTTSTETEIEIDWDREKEEWLSYLQEFYGLIECFVKEYREEGVISFTYLDKTINEKNIGEYTVRKMIMKIKNDEVVFDPIGTSVIGAKGRVDMNGCAGTVRFVLVNEHMFHTEIKSTIQTKETFQSANNVHEANDAEWSWKIASPPPSLQFIDMNEDSFFDALMEIINE